MSRRFWPCHAGGHAAIARSRMRQRVVRHHRLLGHLVDAAEAVAVRARALRRVRRERLGVEHRLPRRIVAGARVQHAQQVRQRRHAADRRARRRRAALLLQRDRRRQAVDRVDLGHAHLVEQPARVRRHRLEVAALRLGVERAERERRLARARHAGEHDQRVARDVDVDVLEVVLARAADAHESIDRHACAPGKACAAGASPHTRAVTVGLRVTVRAMRIFDAAATHDALHFEALIPALRELFAPAATCRRATCTRSPRPGDAGVTLLIMPAWHPGRYFGIKTVNIAPGNAARGLPGLHSTYLLYDADHRRAAGADRWQRDHRAPHRGGLGAGRVLPGARRRAPAAGGRRRARRAPAARGLPRGAADRAGDGMGAPPPRGRGAGRRAARRRLRRRGGRRSRAAVAAADIVSCATLATEPLIQRRTGCARAATST